MNLSLINGLIYCEIPIPPYKHLKSYLKKYRKNKRRRENESTLFSKRKGTGEVICKGNTRIQRKGIVA